MLTSEQICDSSCPDEPFSVMGVVIELKDQLADRSRPRAATRGAFFYDVGCPFCYILAERIERELGHVDWVPVPAVALDDRAGWTRFAATRVLAERQFEATRVLAERQFEATRVLAERQARALRLPLVWPDEPAVALPVAMRAATYAGEQGAGPRFALAAVRLAFCGGFDLDDPETLGIAAVAAGIPVAGCLAAAEDARRDAALSATARGLRSHGMRRLPVIRLGRRWFQGPRALEQAAAVGRGGALRSAWDAGRDVPAHAV
jgi:predicted DsbA family dithiol-disulfide isomerase